MRFRIIHDCPACGQHILPVIGSQRDRYPVFDHSVSPPTREMVGDYQRWIHCPQCYAWLGDLVWIVGGDPKCEHRWDEVVDEESCLPRVVCQCGAVDKIETEYAIGRALEEGTRVLAAEMGAAE